MSRLHIAPFLLLVLVFPIRAADNPLSEQIDQFVQKRLDAKNIPASPHADDAEFLRRVYLDITGRIPTYEQTVAFLGSTDVEKRTKLIDQLLLQPEYGLNFATIWRELLVDRSAESSQVRQSYSWEFIAWMAEGLNKDRGWNAIVADLITAEGEAKKNPATVLVLANRMNNFPRPADVASTAGKLFMGIQLRCAQCHDHPYVDEWKQDDFWGVAAFFSQVRDHGMQADGNSQNPVLFDRPNPDEKKETGYLNRLKRSGLLPPPPGAQIAIPQISDPTQTMRVVSAKFFQGDSLTPPSALGKANLGHEEGKQRNRFAAWLTSPENPYFARAAANRLWSHFFARGFFPVDDARPNQPASHPELLELLEKEFKSAGFNQKHLIRAICNSETYQRTSRPVPKNKEDNELFSHMAIKLLSADQAVDAFAIAVGRAPTIGKNRDQQTALFVTSEADDDRTEFSHGIPQFLQIMNSGMANSNPPIVGKITSGKTKPEGVRALYLAALSREPRPAELQRMVSYLEGGEMNQRYRDIYWVLLNSAEFILNH